MFVCVSVMEQDIPIVNEQSAPVVPSVTTPTEPDLNLSPIAQKRRRPNVSGKEVRGLRPL